MSIKKQYLKSRPVCKVTFRLPQDSVDSTKHAHIVGEFNGWDTDATSMKRLKSGSFVTTIDLEVGREYQFRYLLDGMHWRNDSDAEKHVPTPYGDSENSVIVV